MIKKFKLLFSLQQISKIFPRLYPKALKSSQYGKALRESNKIKKFYGDPALKYLKKVFQKKQYFPFQKQETFFRFLESRLDVVLYRSGFFETINTAKQQVCLGSVQVNKKTVFSPKYILQPGDIIEIVANDQGVSTASFKRQEKSLCARSNGKAHHFLSKLKVNKKKIAWRFQRSPLLLFLINNASTLLDSCDGVASTSTSTNQRFVKRFVSHNEAFIDREFLNSGLPDTPNQELRTQNKADEKDGCQLVDHHKDVSDNFKDTKKFIYKRFINFSLFKTPQNENFQRFFEPNVLKQPFLTTKQEQSLIGFYQSKFFEREEKLFYSLKQNTNQIISKFFINSHKSNTFSSQEMPILNFNKDLKTKLQKNWLASIYNLFLKKKAISSQNNGLKQKNVGHSVQIPNLEQRFFLRNSSAKVSPNMKHTKASFNFFKDQPFFISKKTKPLHLEISYKSRCIVFLFPPQRICLPNYINLSQIYK